MAGVHLLIGATLDASDQRIVQAVLPSEILKERSLIRSPSSFGDSISFAACLQDTRNIALREDNPQAFATLLAKRLQFEAGFANPSIQNGGYARLLDARRDHDCTGFLGQITSPTCLLTGRFDRQARTEAQKALCAALPNANFHRFDAGHGVLLSTPDATKTALDAILTANTNRAKLVGDIT